MKDYNNQTKVLTKNALVLIDRILTQFHALTIDYITDDNLVRNLNHLVAQLKNLKLVVEENPRYDWIMLQEEIDRLYSIDKNLHGVRLILRWKDGNNLAFIKGKIGKAS